MKVFTAENDDCETHDVLSVHLSREGAIAACRAYVKLHAEWRDGWRQPPEDWQGERWILDSYASVVVEEREVLP